MSYPRQAQLEAFQSCANKLRANYGKEKFPAEKCDLMWEELRDFSPKQIRNICDVLLGECPYAPTLSQLREKACLLREKIRRAEKENERNQAQEFHSSFSDSEVQETIKTIRKRAMGGVSDNEFSQFKDVLKKAGGE